MDGKVTSLAFVLCVERGALEQQAILLAESIRRWGGWAAESPIHAYPGRAGHEPPAATTARLGELGVHVHPEAVNRQLAEYPFANQVYAAVRAEETADADVLVFCQSDTVLLAAPDELALGPAEDAAAAPVQRVLAGSTGPGHANEPYWERLYELARADGRPWTATIQTGKRIRGYWNPGVLAVRREAGIMRAWANVLERLIEERHLPEKNPATVDMLALAAALADFRVRDLSGRYNHPLARRATFEGELSTLELGEIAHVHYHEWFNRPRLLHDLRPPLDPAGERFRWLDERLPLQPTFEAPLPGSDESGGGERRRFRRALHDFDEIERALREG